MATALVSFCFPFILLLFYVSISIIYFLVSYFFGWCVSTLQRGNQKNSIRHYMCFSLSFISFPFSFPFLFCCGCFFVSFSISFPLSYISLFLFELFFSLFLVLYFFGLLWAM
jgi:hypothetical protein